MFLILTSKQILNLFIYSIDSSDFKVTIDTVIKSLVLILVILTLIKKVKNYIPFRSTAAKAMKNIENTCPLEIMTF